MFKMSSNLATCAVVRTMLAPAILHIPLTAAVLLHLINLALSPHHTLHIACLMVVAVTQVHHYYLLILKTLFHFAVEPPGVWYRSNWVKLMGEITLHSSCKGSAVCNSSTQLQARSICRLKHLSFLGKTRFSITYMDARAAAMCVCSF